MTVLETPPAAAMARTTSTTPAGARPLQTQTLRGWRWRRHTETGEGAAWTACAHDRATTEIFTDLLDAQQIPDPFVDDNERRVQWVGEADWEYECTFAAEEEPAAERQHDLVLEGLDTFCTAYVNGARVLESDNMFHRHRVSVGAHVRPGGADNTLRLVFRSALRAGRALEAQLGPRFCSNGEASRLYVRKAQYHYGWDWGPVLVSCGPYRPVRLETYDAACVRIADVFAHAAVADDLQSATLHVQWDVVGPAAAAQGLDGQDAADVDADVDVRVDLFSPDGTLLQTATQRASAGEARGAVALAVARPQLWYPLHHGAQALYAVRVRAERGTVCLQDETLTVGMRRVRLVQEPLRDEPGTSFFFEINNRPVFVSGSNWIPRHSFLTALTADDYAGAVAQAAAGNQNMLRVWGGGVYEDDALYAACDRAGVLVWQDFLFACGVYPCHAAFAASVRREAADQVRRLRRFCSVVVYAGNNEDYVAAELQGLAWDPADRGSGDWTATDFPARTLYETVLPAVLAEHAAPGTCYHPGSPWGGASTGDRTAGDIHQWEVWHGSQQPYQLWDKLTGRFVSEYGMLALPAAATVRACIADPRERHPQSRLLAAAHTKAQGAAARLAAYVLDNLRVPVLDLPAWVYATQLVQAESTACAAASFRREWHDPAAGRALCGGHLVWQADDCWPCASWALVDFYGRPKLAYYALKRAAAPLALGLRRSTPALKRLRDPPPPVLNGPHDLADKTYVLDLWLSSIAPAPAPGPGSAAAAAVEMRVFDIASGAVVAARTWPAQAWPANRVTELLADYAVDPTVAVQARLLAGEAVLARAADWPQPLKDVRLADDPGLVAAVVADGLVQLTARAPVKGVELFVAGPDDGGRDDARNDAVRWDDNGVDVFPGDVYTIRAPGLRRGDVVGVRYYGM